MIWLVAAGVCLVASTVCFVWWWLKGPGPVVGHVPGSWMRGDG